MTREHRGGARQHKCTDPKPMRRPRCLELQTRCIVGRARLLMHAQRAYRARVLSPTHSSYARACRRSGAVAASQALTCAHVDELRVLVPRAPNHSNPKWPLVLVTGEKDFCLTRKDFRFIFFTVKNIHTGSASGERGREEESAMADQMEPPKEDFSVGPLSVLSESVKKNCQVVPAGGAAGGGGAH